MVEQSREPFLLPFLCCFSHTIQSLGHSFPALCRARVGLNDVLLGPRPFLPSLRRRSLFFVRLVHRYYGAVRPLRSVRVRIVALRLRGPALFPFGPRHSRGLPVLVHVVSQRARVLRLRRTACSLAIVANSRVAFRHQESVGVLIFRFSKLNSPAHRYPCLRFERRLATPPARLRAKMESLLLSRRTLSFPTTCRFNPALPGKRRHRKSAYCILRARPNQQNQQLPKGAAAT